MRYQPGFPKTLENPIEKARDQAELALRAALRIERAHRPNCAYDFVVSVFRELARQANEAVRQGIWSIADSAREVESFLAWELIPHAYELARVEEFRPAPLQPGLTLEQFRDRSLKHLKDSDVWRSYLEERSGEHNDLDLDERVEAAAAPAGSAATPPLVRNSDFSWQNVTIRFTSEAQVQATINGVFQPVQSYEALGFADGRTTNPNFAWQALQELARQGGTLGSVPKFCEWAKNWEAVEKRMEEVRELLRRHFQTDADPVPFVKDEGYKTAFRIDPGSAFTTHPDSGL